MKKKNELNRLFKRLLILYTVTTGLVLTAFFAISFVLGQNQTAGFIESNFKNCIKNAESNICSNSSVSDSWLVNYEYRNNLEIFAYDNGVPIFYNGTTLLPDSREYLQETAFTIFSENDDNILSRPQTASKIESDVYRFTGQSGEKYSLYGAAVVTENGYRSFVVVQHHPELTGGRIKTLIIYALIDVAGIILLLLAGMFVIRMLLKPVKESRERQTSFIASASHELKAPLAVIRAQNSSSAQDCINSQKIIEDECRRLSKLIDDMLIIASCDSGNWSVKQEVVETETIMSDIYEMFSTVAMEKGISISIDMPENSLPDIIGDRSRIVQLLSVLADNAISYSDEKSEVEFQACSDDKYVYISIKDHGKGIPDEKKKYIYDRFYRFDKSHSSKSHFGLGLSIAKELATLMNAEIMLEDTNGGGCTFTAKFIRST